MCWDSGLEVRTFRGLADRADAGDLTALLARHYVLRRSPSGQAPGDSAAHLKVHYRCFLPNLAGFAVSDCTEPETCKRVCVLRKAREILDEPFRTV